jgi:hypothetical protein
LPKIAPVIELVKDAIVNDGLLSVKSVPYTILKNATFSKVPVLKVPVETTTTM